MMIVPESNRVESGFKARSTDVLIYWEVGGKSYVVAITTKYVYGESQCAVQN